MTRALRVLACAGALAAFAVIPTRAAAVGADPRVRVVIHVALAVPELLQPGSHPSCLGETRPQRITALPDRAMRGYERELSALGPVSDRYGLGTWTVGSANDADVAFEPVDHLFVSLPLSTAKRVIPPLIHRMRIELHQQEVLAEIFGGGYPALGDVRTRVEVLLPFGKANYAAVTRLHRVFGDRGRGGASQYAQADGLHIYSSVVPTNLGRITRELRHAGFRFRTEPETFITDDAPRCPVAFLLRSAPRSWYGPRMTAPRMIAEIMTITMTTMTTLSEGQSGSTSP